MTTYKQCNRCGKVVEFESLEPTRLPHAIVYPMGCFGGNRPDLCGELHELIALELEIAGSPTAKESLELERRSAK